MSNPLRSFTLRERVVANSFYNTVGTGVSILIGVVSVPVIIHYVGNKNFAFLVLANMFISYAALLDLGLETSLTRYAAFYYAGKEYARLNSLIVSAIAANLVLFAIVAGLYAGCGSILFQVVSIPVEDHAPAHLVVIAALSGYFLRLTLGVPVHILNGMQRMDIPIRVGIFTALLNLLSVIYLLGTGLGVVAVAWCQFAFMLVYYVICFPFAVKLFPGLSFSLRRHLSPRALGPAFRYGLSLEISRVCEVFAQQISRLTASMLSDLAYVTHYALAGNIAKSARDLVVNVLVPIIPAASELQAADQPEALLKLYERASKFLVLIAFPLFFSIMASSHLLLYAWVGPGFEAAAYLTRLLCLAFLVNTLTGPGGLVAQGMGRPELTVRPALLDLLLNAALSFGLTFFLGFYGGALGLLTAHACGCVYFFRLFHRTCGTSALAFCRKTYLPPLIFSAILALITAVLNSLPPVAGHAFSRFEAFELAMGEGLAIALLSYLLLYLSGYIEKEDLSDLRLLFRRAR